MNVDEFVEVDPEKMSGTPCFTGTRVPIKHLFDYFARSVAEPKERPGNEVLLFGGAIAAEDLSAMTKAIERECEQVSTL